MKKIIALIVALLIALPSFGTTVTPKSRTFTNGTPNDATPVEASFGELYANDQTLATALTLIESGNPTLTGVKTINGDLSLTGSSSRLLLGIGSDPSSLTNGMLWYNTSTNAFFGRINGATENLNPISNQMDFRLSLASGSPVPNTDQTAKTTVYMTPYKGNYISLYNGTKWITRTSSEVSVSVPATTNTPFDIFAYDNSGTVALETTNWTNDTTRATALAYQDGILVKSGTPTRRYVGTGRTTAVSGQTADALATRYLCNYYNRVPRIARGTFSTTRTTTSTSYTELNTEIRAQFLVCLTEEPVRASFNGTVNTPTGSTGMTAIAFDSTSTVEPGFTTGTGNASGSTLNLPSSISNSKYDITTGYHYATILGASSTAATIGWSSADTPASALAKGYLMVEVKQ